MKVYFLIIHLTIMGTVEPEDWLHYHYRFEQPSLTACQELKQNSFRVYPRVLAKQNGVPISLVYMDAQCLLLPVPAEPSTSGEVLTG